tara:strand:- start:10627 stop:10938 length:312 start_codon:yes stop_codon:yes gene_type:complete
MEIFCNNKHLLDLAIRHAKALSVDSKDAVVTIKRLPPSFTQKGLIEYPRVLDKTTYIDIYIKHDDEREISLAHEMKHLEQVLDGRILDENEAYLYEKHHKIRL